MAENTEINWCHHTWNPWQGCSRVSEGCRNCFAAAWGKRFGVEWGAGKPRRKASESTLKLPFKWNRRAEKNGPKETVFCGSLMDIFDPEVPDEWRDEVFATIALTPWLNWVLLTKRPEKAAKYLNPAGNCIQIGIRQAIEQMGGADIGAVHALPNVWVGTSVENQAAADERLPHLMRIAALGWKVWVSAEPLIGPVDWTEICNGAYFQNPLTGLKYHDELGSDGVQRTEQGTGLSCIVTGGETGPGARPSHPEWFEQTAKACAEAGVSHFHKQNGVWAVTYDRDAEDPDWRDCPAATGHHQRYINIEGGHGFHNERVCFIERVGKKRAGRALPDGTETPVSVLPWFEGMEVSP